MEAHEGILLRIIEFALDGLLSYISFGTVVVDIQQSHCIVADAGSDELT